MRVRSLNVPAAIPSAPVRLQQGGSPATAGREVALRSPDTHARTRAHAHTRTTTVPVAHTHTHTRGVAQCTRRRNRRTQACRVS